MSFVSKYFPYKQISKLRQIYRRDGLEKSVVAIKKKLLQLLMYESFSAGVKAYASHIHDIEDASTHRVNYDGIHSPPHPSQIQHHPECVATFSVDLYEFDQCGIVGGYPSLCTGTTWIRSFPGAPLERSFIRVISHTAQVAISNLANQTCDDTVFLVSGNEGYAHWPSEVLAKFRSIEKSQLDKKISKIIVPPSPNDWQEESLELIGYPSENVCQFDEIDQSVFDTVIIPSTSELLWTGPPYVSPQELKWIRRQVLSEIDEHHTQHGKRLFVSRADANKRNIINQDAVADLLSQFGIDMIIPGNFSYSEQVAAFSNAELIIGPHGAGLTNIMYSENATVIELLIEHTKNKHYYVLSNLLGLKYDYVRCETKEDTHMESRHSDMTVDTERLETVISHYV